MKHNLSLLFLLLSFALAAKPVNPEDAEKIAAAILKQGGSRSVSVHRIAEDKAITKSPSTDAAFYYFAGDRGGFAIVPSDDALPSVIGWAPDGEFRLDGIPANVKAWMDMWRKIYDAMMAGELKEDRGPVYGAGSKLLETANWNQDSPYNSFCPTIGGKTCYTGCVATATAIVMRYHEWPDCAGGTLPSYTFTGSDGQQHYIGSVTLGHAYDWANMPLDMNGASAAQEQAVAQLIYEAGVMVKSNYGTDGTGAYTSDVYPGLVEYYDYDASAFEYYRCYYSDEVWKGMLRSNIDDAGPVLYSGYGEESGHAFVLDGYNAQGQFHINWGWGGYNNGYYVIPAFDEYVDGHAAVLNIRRNAGGSIAEGLVIDGDPEKVKGLSSTAETFRKGEPFGISCQYIFNISERPFNGRLAFAVLHADDSLGAVLDSVDVSIPRLGGVRYELDDCMIEETIRIGDRIRVFFKSENTPAWTSIPANLEAGFIGEIAIADSRSIAEVTSFRYTSSTGILLVSTKEDAQWSLTDSSGQPCTKGVGFDGGALTIDTRQYPLGSYMLTLSKEEDSKTLEFVFGVK